MRIKHKNRILTLLGFLIIFFSLDLIISAVLNRGLDKYFGLADNSEILLIGHSHLMLATDKVMLEDSLGCKISKYCREGVGVDVRKHMIKHFLSLPDKDSLKVVIYGVDQYMFNPTGLSDKPHKLFYPFMDNKEIDTYIRESDSPKDYWTHKLIRITRYSDALLNSSLRGLNNNWTNNKSGQMDITAVKSGTKRKQLREIQMDEKLKTDFEETISLLVNKGIDVVLINTPIVKEYNEYEPGKYNNVILYFDSLANSSDLIHYWDLNPKFSHKYELFFDPIHINSNGQPIVTKEIIRLYKSQFQ